MGFAAGICRAAQSRGLGPGFLIGKSFMRRDPPCLVLGDNIFYGTGLSTLLTRATERETGRLSSPYTLATPSAMALSIQSRWESHCVDRRNRRAPKAITPSPAFISATAPSSPRPRKPQAFAARRNRDHRPLNRLFESEALKVEILGRGIAWLDTGTHESLVDAANFVAALHKPAGAQGCCPEEIAFRKGWGSQPISSSAWRRASKNAPTAITCWDCSILDSKKTTNSRRLF